MRKVIMPLLLFIFLISLASATLDCSITSVSKTMEEGGLIPTVDSFSCTNNYNYSVALNKIGSFFTLSESTPFTIAAGDTKGGIGIFFEDVLTGNYEGMIYSEGLGIPVTLEVTPALDPTACRINPSIVEYNQDFQQGAKTTETITFNPNENCHGDISVSGASIQGGVFVDDGGVSKRKPVSLGIVTPNEININIDTEGLPPKSYENIKLTFNAYDEQHTIKFNIRVSGSAGGGGEFDISNLPKCSLTNNIINLNETHSLVCTNLISDVEIIPKIDTDYIRGMDKEVESNQFVWLFQGKKFGNTIIKAEFYYLGVPVGDPFQQEIKIQSAGQTIAGTDLSFKFFPELSDYTGESALIIQLVDNKTKSLVQEPRIWVNAKELNSTTQSFEYLFESDTDYELRGMAPGYSDLLTTISISPKPITISISPSAGSTSTLFNITTDPINASLFIDEVKVDNPYYSTMNGGSHTLKAVMKGYQTKEINFTVSSWVIISSGCSYENFKKNTVQVCVLSDESNYTVTYRKTPTEQEEQLKNGTGITVEFTPERNGWYYITADGRQVFSKEISGSSFWTAKWWFMYWWLWFVIPVLLIVIFIIIVRWSGSPNPIETTTPYS